MRVRNAVWRPVRHVLPHLNLDDATTTAVTAYKGKPIIVK
jgi:hypothetical protein